MYELVYNFRDKLATVWEERFEEEYGFLRPEVSKTFDAYLNCGIFEHGVARAWCPKCNNSLLVAFSCKTRGVCASCLAKRSILFAEHLVEEVLKPLPHRHVIFSIPKILRIYFKRSRKNSWILFQAAWDMIREMYGIVIPGGRPGAALALQSAGKLLKFNCHLHGLVTNGSLCEDGTFHELPYFDHEKYTAVFADKVFTLMRDFGLIDDERVALIKSWEHSGFSVWAGPVIEPVDLDLQRFIARYIDRAPLSLSKLSIDGDRVFYTTDDGSVHTFDALEFLARLSAQIPQKSESVIRYYGIYSNRYRGEEKKRKLALGEIDEEISIITESKRRASRLWASLIKKVYLVDPLICGKCGEEMKIISFIQNPAEIKKLLRSLNIEPFKVPPKYQEPP